MIRIVRMEFKPEEVPAFIAFFEKSKPVIAAMPGCSGVELYRDASADNVFYTHSLWTGTEALDAYRNTGFFKETWAYTKTLFSGKPQAFSLENV